MMRTMRASAKWIMGVVAFFFVGWMIYGYGMDIAGRGSSRPNTVAKVNGQTIDATTFYAAVRSEQERLRADRGAVAVTLEEQRALENQVLEQMVQDIILKQEFRRRGIRVTDDEVVEAARTSPPPEVLEMPQFQTDGQFDLEKYQRFVASSADPNFLLALEARYRDELPRLKFFDQITAGTYVSDAELWRQFRDRNDSVTAVVLALFPQTAVPDSAVTLTTEQVDRYYREHRDAFTRPATAYLSYLSLSRIPSPADSAAARDRAREIAERIRGGEDFGEVAQRESSDSVSAAEGGDLGDVPLGRFVAPFEEAALALRPGQVSDPVLSPFGYHVIRLEARTDSSFHARHVLVPVEMVGDHLNEVESRADTLDLYAAEQDDPAALDQVAGWLGLSVATTTPLTEGGRLQVDNDVVGDAGVWAFGGDVHPGQSSPVIETTDRYYVFRLDSLIPEGVPPIEQIRERVRVAARRAAKAARTEEIAREIAGDLAGGATLEEAAAGHGHTTQTVGPFTRYTPAPVFQNAPAAAGAAFAMGVGETSGPVPTPVGTYFVRTVRKVVADSSQFVAQRDALRLQALRQARQQRVQLAMSSLRRAANVQDLRKELERAQREAADAALPNPLGS